MIQLFNIPKYVIDTSEFSNLLHDKIVDEFTEKFCEYVGVKYGCATNSASSAIFLLSYYRKLIFDVPTMIPPVVINSIVNGGSHYRFVDDYKWMGGSYLLFNKNYRIIDSAQEVKPIKLYGQDIAIYSFYPTKPVGSCDGGMIVSNDKDTIDFFKKAVYNGGNKKSPSWNNEPCFPGWKMYMNSIQACMALKSLRSLNEKKESLQYIRNKYNKAFNLNNNSDHLYRISVDNQKQFMAAMDSRGIQCGIHYYCAHKMIPYYHPDPYTNSAIESKHTVSIPFHERLTKNEVDWIIKCVYQNEKLLQP